jgi:hypothetical protein
MPPPDPPLSPAILAALGLIAGCTGAKPGTDTGTLGPCLLVLPTTTTSPCLAPIWETGETGDSGDSGDSGDTGATGQTGDTGAAATGDTADPADTGATARGTRIQRLAAEGVLPADVIERLLR